MSRLLWDEIPSPLRARIEGLLGELDGMPREAATRVLAGARMEP